MLPSAPIKPSSPLASPATRPTSARRRGLLPISLPQHAAAPSSRTAQAIGAVLYGPVNSISMFDAGVSGVAGGAIAVALAVGAAGAGALLTSLAGAAGRRGGGSIRAHPGASRIHGTTSVTLEDRV